jgi:NAD(P)-dependent dehydrogenase (short-subunit alcohol dehydrogenase family)
MTRFAGRVAIVTGAAGGVGAQTVRRLLDGGAQVLACDRDADRLAATSSPHDSEGLELLALDLRDHASADRVVAAAMERFGRLDTLINNAGVTIRAALERTTDDLWDTALDINLGAAFRLSRAAAPEIRSAGGGAIVNVASINALRGNFDLCAYSASKAGLVGLTRALAVELARDGIRVNAVCPGTVDTPMLDEYLDSVADPVDVCAALAAKHPLGRIATAGEVADAIAFLASDEARFVTGVAMPVDGGRHIG